MTCLFCHYYRDTEDFPKEVLGECNWTKVFALPFYLKRPLKEIGKTVHANDGDNCKTFRPISFNQITHLKVSDA